jgi:polysaccharide pyruvyl transferase WcaK-like protein
LRLQFARPWVVRLNRLLLNIPRAFAFLIMPLLQMLQFDVLIIPGTGILEDWQDRPWGKPLSVFWWCLAAKMVGVKIAFVCTGVGARRPENGWLLTGAARLADYRSYRDETSKEFMRHAGANVSRDRVYADLVFQLPVPSNVAPQAARNHLVVGLGVISYAGWRGTDGNVYRAYRDKMAAFADWLLEQDHRVRIITSQLRDPAVAKDILQAVSARRNGLSPDAIVYEPAGSVHEAMQQFAMIDVAVVARYHAIVSALKVGKPTISVSYSAKHGELLRRMGLPCFSQPIEEIDLDVLKAQFQQLVKNREEYERSIVRTNAAFLECLAEQEEILTHSFLS